MKKIEFYLTLVLSELSYGKQMQLLEKYSTINEIVTNRYDANIKTILSIEEYQRLVDVATSGKIARHLDGIKRNNISLISLEDAQYPECLRNIHEPPIMLYYKGDINILNTDCIAIVGSRVCTTYGSEQAKKFAKELSQAGFTIVSGLAEGIDASAHIGALEAKGKTIAVMAGGLNNIYPAINANLAKQIIDNGGLLISENKPSFLPKSYSFIQRNRIIAGLSQGVFSPEMGLKSGAMHTINFALDEGRQVFALPGNVTSNASKGTNNLICTLQGACVLEPEDIIQNFEGHQKPQKRAPTRPITEQLTIEEQIIVDTLKLQDAHFDDLAKKTGLETKKLNSLLTMMEIRGLIKKLAGNYYGL
ncbi:MAG: DNA-processing protein DprA [Clostridia bacterium]|nr:DNA-processing protein DprA [Clostridia bacterium]